MKNLNNYVIEKLKINSNSQIEEPLNIHPNDDFMNFLKNNNYKFVEEDNHVDKLHNVIVSTKYNNVTVKFSFISSYEFLYEIDKGDDMIMYEQSSKHIDRFEEEDFKRFCDPMAYFNKKLQFCKKKLNSARKPKRNRRTGDMEVNRNDIYFYQSRIAKIEKWIEKLK